MAGMKGIHRSGLLTFRETSCLTKLIIVSEGGMEGSKFTGTVQNWCVFSSRSYYSGQVESESLISVGVQQHCWSGAH